MMACRNGNRTSGFFLGQTFRLNQPTSPKTMPLLGLRRAMGIAKTVEVASAIGRDITLFVPYTRVAPIASRVIDEEA
jgi:hypothetical protein